MPCILCIYWLTPYLWRFNGRKINYITLHYNGFKCLLHGTPTSWTPQGFQVKLNSPTRLKSAHKKSAHRLLAINSSWRVPAPTETADVVCSSKYPCIWPHLFQHDQWHWGPTGQFSMMCASASLPGDELLINKLGQCVKHLSGAWKKIK